MSAGREIPDGGALPRPPRGPFGRGVHLGGKDGKQALCGKLADRAMDGEPPEKGKVSA